MWSECFLCAHTKGHFHFVNLHVSGRRTKKHRFVLCCIFVCRFKVVIFSLCVRDQPFESVWNEEAMREYFIETLKAAITKNGNRDTHKHSTHDDQVFKCLSEILCWSGKRKTKWSYLQHINMIKWRRIHIKKKEHIKIETS